MRCSNLAGIEDLEMILRPLSNYMRPMLINYLKERRKALFTENTEKMKRLLDNLQKRLDEVRTITSANFHSVFRHPSNVLYHMLSAVRTSHCGAFYMLNYFVPCLQAFLNMQLYEKALDLFEDDQSTSVSSDVYCK